MYGYIHSIESFGTVDGPGIRFVVFMQGCPMRCLYCHNPDTWAFSKNNPVTADELLEQYDSCRAFLKSGGLTVTGGEPLAQPEFVTELFEKAKLRKIHTCLDTSGITFSEDKRQKFSRLMNVTDLVMLDIKHIDDEEHMRLTGFGNENVLDFVRFLDDMNKEVWIRHVVVPNLTDNRECLRRLGEFIGKFNCVKALDVLPYHNMGREKYGALNIPYKLGETPSLSMEKAEEAKKIIMSGIYDTRHNYKTNEISRNNRNSRID